MIILIGKHGPVSSLNPAQSIWGRVNPELVLAFVFFLVEDFGLENVNPPCSGNLLLFSHSWRLTDLTSRPLRFVCEQSLQLSDWSAARSQSASGAPASLDTDLSGRDLPATVRPGCAEHADGNRSSISSAFKNAHLVVLLIQIRIIFLSPLLNTARGFPF